MSIALNLDHASQDTAASRQVARTGERTISCVREPPGWSGCGFVGVVAVVAVGVVEVLPAETGADLVEDRDRSFRVWGGAVVVEGGVPVVGSAFEPSVELCRLPAEAVGDDVIHIAALDRDVTAGRVLAVPVADFDGAA